MSKIQNLDDQVVSTSEQTPTYENVVKKDVPKQFFNPTVNTVQNPTSNVDIKVWKNEELTDGNILGQVVLQTLQTYENIMQPKKPIDRKIGGRQQITLYNTYLRVAQTKKDFDKNWNIILNRFYENPNGVYGLQYVNRFLDQMTGLTKMDLTLFNRFNNLIILTCDPYKRQENLKRVSLEKTLSIVSSDVIRSNILNFYRKDF